MQSHGAPGGACATPTTVRTCWSCGRRGVCAMCIVNRFTFSMRQLHSHSHSHSRSLSRRQRRRLHGHAAVAAKASNSLSAISLLLVPSHLLSCYLAHCQPPMGRECGRGERGGKQQYAGPNSAHALHVRAPNVGQEGKSRAHLSLVAYIQRQLRGVAVHGECEQQRVYGGRG